MPFVIRTSLSFAGYEQGWSESFYWNKDDDNLQTAEDIITPIAQKRAKLLASGYTLTVVRNAVIENNAGAKVKRVTDLFEPRIPGVASWAASTPNLSLLCVWQNAANNKSKKQYMRGIPAGIGDLGKTVDLTFGAFLSNFNAWRAAMIALPAGWLATSVTATAVVNSYVVDADDGIVTFALQSPGLVWPVNPGFPTTVHVKLPGSNPMDGDLLIVPVTNTVCYTAKRWGVRPWTVGQLGIMQLRSPSLVTLAGTSPGGPTGMIHPQRIISHKTGRPSYASRGRSADTLHW